MAKKNESKKVEAKEIKKTQEVKEMAKSEKAPKVEAPKVEEKVEIKNAKEIVMNEKFMADFHKSEKVASKNAQEYLTDRIETLKKSENVEYVMLTQESRKVYYLFEIIGGEYYYIGEFKAIMEIKIFVVKVAAILKKELKAHYFKPGRKNQSSEKLTGKSYFDKIEKYANI